MGAQGGWIPQKKVGKTLGARGVRELVAPVYGGGYLCRMSILRNGNVTLMSLKIPLVTSRAIHM